jgi:6-phosphogluconolactonase
VKATTSLLFVILVGWIAMGCTNPPLNADKVFVVPSSQSMTIGSTQSVTVTSYNEFGLATKDKLSLSLNLGPGTTCGSSPGLQCGSITPASVVNSGTAFSFTAPNSVPNPGGGGTPGFVDLNALDCLLGSNASCSASPPTGAFGFDGITITSNVSISVSAQSSPINPGSNSATKFTATVSNDPNNLGVTWSLSGASCNGNGNPCGTLAATTPPANSPANVFAINYTPPATAPANPITLVAIAIADYGKKGSTGITLTSAAAIGVAVNPPSATVQAGGANALETRAAQFMATITNDSGGTNKVNWALFQGATACATLANPAATCGSISAASSSNGVNITYTAPPTAAAQMPITLTATSQTDGKTSNSATITVNPSITVSVPAQSGSIVAGSSSSTQFTATVANDPTPANGVAWSLTLAGVTCAGNPACGTLSAAVPPSSLSNLYTPPAAVPAGALMLIATSVTDPSIFGSTGLTISPTPPPSVFPRFLYTANPGRITVHTINFSTGQLRFHGFAQVGLQAAVISDVVTAEAGQYVYAADTTTGAIYGFTPAAADGTLTPIAGTPVSLTNLIDIAAVTVTSNSKTFLYGLNPGTGVTAYQVGANGTLGSGQATAVPGAFTQMAFDPAGKYAFFAESGEIGLYSITANGLLSVAPTSPVAAGTAGSGNTVLAVSPSGQFLYALNQNDSKVHEFSIGVDGLGNPTLTSIGTTSALDVPQSLAIDPLGKFLFVSDDGSSNDPAIAPFSIQGNGTLSALATVPTLEPATALSVDPTDGFLFVSEPGILSTFPQIQTFTISTSSGLTLTPVQVVGESATGSLAIVSGASAVTYSPQYAYVTNAADNTVSMFSVDPSTGNLTSLTSAVGVQGGNSGAITPTIATADPFGRFVYTLDAGGFISAFTVNGSGNPPAGALTEVAGMPFGSAHFAVSMAIDGSGQFAYVSKGMDSVIAGYTITQPSGTSPGALTVISKPLGLFGFGSPEGLAVSPFGSALFIADQEFFQFYASTINTDGTLSKFTGAPFQFGSGNFGVLGPTLTAVDPTNRFVYVVASSDVVVFSFNASASGGTLTALSGTGSKLATGNGPNSIAIDPSGRYLYIGNGTDKTISAYSINQATGLLTAIAGGPISVSTGVSGVFFDPSGKFLYTESGSASGTNGVITRFTIDFTTGLPSTTIASRTFSAGSGPAGITITVKIQ